MLTVNTLTTLKNLPTPPLDKKGWPWTEASQPLPATMPNGESWPKISIVTPSYNQGEFVEETIRSVLLQGYPNLEYIVIDGGSTDRTKEILERYAPWLSYVVSEPDEGQSDAINKGFARASGFVRGYLNSDDLFLPDALRHVASVAADYLGQSIIIAGDSLMGNACLSDVYATCRSTLPENFATALEADGYFPQPSTFWTQPTTEVQHIFNSSLVFCMDREFWIKLFNSGYKAVKLERSLAFYRHHDDAKGTLLTDFFWSEKAGIAISYIENLQSLEDKIFVARASQIHMRHYFRIIVRKILATEGATAAIKALFKICLANPSMIFDRSTLGLMRRLLFSSSKFA